MQTGMAVLEKRAAEAGIGLEKQIPEATFVQLDLPLIVACTGCRTTMLVLSALIDCENQAWCADCAGEEA